ncbi:MAG TPA: hypothetical protein VHE81_06650 [Lacipirellulaceae bacterium]|jgi:hypothetical protein|nr:hypothetical protein [Lacipirellulaceae bacterium]
MAHMKDWRPERLDTEAIATDAHLARIEAKLDLLLSGVADQFRHFNETNQNDFGICNTCGKPVKHHG